jgi:hypothetical protein
MALRSAHVGQDGGGMPSDALPSRHGKKGRSRPLHDTVVARIGEGGIEERVILYQRTVVITF